MLGHYAKLVMKHLFEILVLTLCAFIIINRGEKRTKIFLFSSFFMPASFGTAHILLPVSFLISLWRSGDLKYEIKTFPLKNISIVILLIYFLVALGDNRISIPESIIRPITYFIKTYLYLFVGYTLVKSEKNWNRTARTLLQIFSIFAIYGVVTWILQTNPWYDFTSQVYGQETVWGESDRGYRTTSFLNNAIAYGIVMVTGTFTIWLYYQKHANRRNLILLVIIVANIFLANSRTGIVSFALAIVLYIILYNGLSGRTILSFMGVCIALVVAYFSMDFIRPVMDSVIDLITTGGNNTKGSNMELRNDQLATSLIYFREAPFLGHGIYYYSETIFPRLGSFSGLAGLEGYGFRLLIEMGGFMIVAFIVYVIRFVHTAIKGRKINKQWSSVVIAQFIAFVFYLMATGDYGNVFEYCFILIGINLKYLLLPFNKQSSVSTKHS